jgi:hypothetical protein
MCKLLSVSFPQLLSVYNLSPYLLIIHVVKQQFVLSVSHIIHVLDSFSLSDSKHLYYCIIVDMFYILLLFVDLWNINKTSISTVPLLHGVNSNR